MLKRRDSDNAIPPVMARITYKLITGFMFD
jgi:hypothetical protein